MSHYEKEGYYEASTLLGQQIAKTEGGKFLSKTSCMDQQTRELMAILEYIKMLHPERKKRIDKIMVLFEMLGNARWQRDVITDLALKRGIEETMKDKSVIR